MGGLNKSIRHILIAFTLCSLLAGCSIIETDNNTLQKKILKDGEVAMNVHDIVFDDEEWPDTRTEAIVDEIKGLSFKWSEGDQVGVYSQEGGMALFSLAAGQGTGSAIFNGSGFSLTSGKTYYAFYPYNGSATDCSKLELDYSGRSINGNGNLADATGLAFMQSNAQAEDGGTAAFGFSHLSSFVRLNLTLPQSSSISSIDIIPTYDPLADELTYNLKNNSSQIKAGPAVKTIPVNNVSSNNLTAWLPMIPQVIEDAAIVVNSSDGRYTARVPGKNLKAGKAYRWEAEASSYPGSLSSDMSLTDAYTNILSLGDFKGDFSGITWIPDSNRYAIVNDKGKGGGIVLLEFKLGNNGSISNLTCTEAEGNAESTASRDPEGIVYVPSSNTLFVAGEADQQILEYDMDGRPTGRKLNIPADMSKSSGTGNCGFEALAYNATKGLFWTTTESTLPKDKSYSINNGLMLRLQSFSDKDLEPGERYLYMMDAPAITPASGATYAYGVPDILALDDGKLIVMEREAYVPAGTLDKLSSSTKIKLYLVDPEGDKGGILSKKLLKTISTTIAGWANYEGICLGPKLSGSNSILLINDSQSRYSNFLLDYIYVLKY